MQIAEETLKHTEEKTEEDTIKIPLNGRRSCRQGADLQGGGKASESNRASCEF